MKAVDATGDASLLDRAVARVFIGVWYVVLFPFHINSYGYGLSILVAAVYGLWVRRRRRITVLEKSEHAVVYWVRRGKKGEEEQRPKPTPPLLTPRQ